MSKNTELTKVLEVLKKDYGWKDDFEIDFTQRELVNNVITIVKKMNYITC